MLSICNLAFETFLKLQLLLRRMYTMLYASRLTTTSACIVCLYHINIKTIEVALLSANNIYVKVDIA